MSRMNFGNQTLEQTGGQNPPTREQSANLGAVGPGHVAIRRQGPADPAAGSKLVSELTGGTETNPPRP